MEREQELSIARVLADLMRDAPELYRLFRDTMEDPRKNHVIHEETEWDD
jgi:hypothetical protein